MHFNMARSIAFIVDRMNVTSGEKVLVYCEAEKAKIGELLVAESLRRGRRQSWLSVWLTRYTDKSHPNRQLRP